MQPRNLAARAGRWSAQHRKTAILGWIAFVVLATLIGGKVGLKLIVDRHGGLARAFEMRGSAAASQARRFRPG